MKRMMTLTVATVILSAMFGLSVCGDKEKTPPQIATVAQIDSSTLCYDVGFIVYDSINNIVPNHLLLTIVVDTGQYEGRTYAQHSVNIAGYTEFHLPIGLWRVYVEGYFYKCPPPAKFEIDSEPYRDTIYVEAVSRTLEGR